MSNFLSFILLKPRNKVKAVLFKFDIFLSKVNESRKVLKIYK